MEKLFIQKPEKNKKRNGILYLVLRHNLDISFFLSMAQWHLKQTYAIKNLIKLYDIYN